MAFAPAADRDGAQQAQPGVERALLVQLDLGQGNIEERSAELDQLAVSAGARPVGLVSGHRKRPDPSFFVGKGKVEQIADQVDALSADLVIFNHGLSAVQQRNLERELRCRVVDRDSLILDIFAQRANSHEGKLQVELAQLQHLSTRLVRGWTHLERQKGGIGLRGPGETQLETDRRLIGKRVKVLKERLQKLERQRTVRRRSRSRGSVFDISLVGYTNAGKSTLFNQLTRAGTLAANRLFETLDTLSRQLHLDGVGPVVLSDTVGFIRDLPHTLVAAFHATLEETAQADLLLHVVDFSSPDRDMQIHAVGKVLEEIGASQVPQILVWNKIDATPAEPAVERDAYGKITGIRISAKTGSGLDLLRQALIEVQQELPTHRPSNFNIA